jgi:hypothetical protein
MLKKTVVIIISLLFILINCINSMSAQPYEGRGLRIECNPETVTLSPGESTTVHFRIKNLSNSTFYIELEYISTEDFGLTQGTLSDNHFPLQPNTTHIGVLELTASNGWFHSENTNDGFLEVTWGPDNIRDPREHVQGLSNIRNITAIKIEVTKNMTIPHIIFSIIFIISIIIITVTINKHRKKKEQ